MRRFVLAGLVVLAGCGASQASIPGGRVVSTTVAGQPVQVLVPARLTRRPDVIVWFHSRDSDEQVTTLGLREPFFAAVVRAGVLVASDRADGNAWGNAASVEDYRSLIAWLTRRYDPGRIVLVGESMGGLPSLEVVERPPPRVVGWIGISPVTNIAWAARVPAFAREVAQERGTGPTGRVRMPMLWFASPQDTTVPMRQNPAPGAVYIACRGPHLDPSCRQPGVVLRFVAALH